MLSRFCIGSLQGVVALVADRRCTGNLADFGQQRRIPDRYSVGDTVPLEFSTFWK